MSAFAEREQVLVGVELAGELRQLAYPEPLLLIAFTGYGQDEDSRRVREAGFDNHIINPVEPTTLERLIDAVPVSSAATPAAD
jgi:CheY-like chemotaxis protein